MFYLPSPCPPTPRGQNSKQNIVTLGMAIAVTGNGQFFSIAIVNLHEEWNHLEGDLLYSIVVVQSNLLSDLFFIHNTNILLSDTISTKYLYTALYISIK